MRKRKADNLVVQSCKRKCAALEEKVKVIDNKLKDVTNKMESLKKSNKKLSQALITKQSSANKQGRNYKSWSEYSPQYMRIKK